jgi:excisionase family DNA binding protein
MKNINEEILSLSEATDFLKIKKSCLYKKTSQKQIPYYKPPGCKQIYFLKKDLENWILCNKINSVSEIENEVESYLIKSQKKSNYDN